MALEHPGLVLLAAAFALVGLYLLTKRPVVWRNGTLFIVLLIGCFWLEQLAKGIREGQGAWGILTFSIVFAIAPGIFIARELLGRSESWSIHNAGRGQVIAALDRVLERDAIPFDWRLNRLRLPTIGIGGTTLLVRRWFGGTSIEVIAADRDDRRIAARTLLPRLRRELAGLPRPIIPWSGVFFLLDAVLLLFVATQLPKLFN